MKVTAEIAIDGILVEVDSEELTTDITHRILSGCEEAHARLLARCKDSGLMKRGENEGYYFLDVDADTTGEGGKEGGTG